MVPKHHNVVRLLLAVAVAATVGSALAAGAFAGHAKRGGRWPISAFRHPLHRAHAAGAATTIPLTGTTDLVLAAVSGTNDVYLARASSPATSICYWEQVQPAGGHGGCALASVIESVGGVSVYQPKEGAPLHVVAIVPDGVQSVVVTDSSGSHTVDVTNNVADYEDQEPTSVSYTLPDGVAHVSNLSALTKPLLTQRPGDASSSE